MKVFFTSCFILLFSNCVFSQSIKELDNNQNTSLPEIRKEFVKLDRFSAKVNANLVSLSWQTYDEKNNQFFSLERSTDLENWQVVSTISPQKQKMVNKNYLFNDEQPYFGKSYYRLKQTDIDGRFSYSDIEIVTITPDSQNKLVAFPNPTIDFVEVALNKKELSQLKVLNLSGEDFTKNIKISFTENGYASLDFTNAPAGVYVISTNTNTTQIVKQ